MKHLIIKYKNKIKKRFDEISFEDFFNNSKKYSFKITDKLKTKLKKKYTQYGIDAYAYKAKEYFNKVQDKIEKSFDKLSFDESLLKQSSFWLKSVTWTLIGTSSFAVIWLGFARTDEVVIALGKLEPKGDVKDIQIPIGGVIDAILVQSGDSVEKNQVLVQLDKEASFEKFRSFQNALEEKELQLEKITSILSLKREQKQQELLLINERIRSITEKKEMDLVLLNKLEELYENGGISKFKYFEYKMQHDDIISELSRLKIEKEISAGVINQDLVIFL